MTPKNYRRPKGHFLADAPIAIWIVIILLFVPLLDFSAVLLRSSLLYVAVHNAARNAAKARTFLAPLAGQPSATQLATTTVDNVAALWSGVTINSVLAEIVITDISTDVVSRQSSPLTTPANDATNTYQLEVTVTGTVFPLVTFNIGLFGAVPGLTQPIVVTMSDRQYVENPQGLVL
jgi:hypothetical protein